MDGDTITSTTTARTMTPAERHRERARECRQEAVRCDNRSDQRMAAYWRGYAAALDDVATTLEVAA